MRSDAVKGLIEGTLRAMGIDAEDVVFVDDGVQPLFDIQTRDSALLIGNQGESLKALNHVVKRLAERAVGAREASKFLLDVNSYQKKKLAELRSRARMLGERARLFRYDVEMSPMNAYERMIVHATFANDPDIVTESHGEGKFRRVVLRYRDRSDNA